MKELEALPILKVKGDEDKWKREARGASVVQRMSLYRNLCQYINSGLAKIIQQRLQATQKRGTTDF